MGMAGAQKHDTKAKKKTNTLLLPVFFLVYTLIKLGQIPQLIFKIRFRPSIATNKRRLKKVEIKKVQPRIVLFKRKRGRPRKQPLLQFLLKKIKRAFKKILPSPLRVGLALAFIV